MKHSTLPINHIFELFDTMLKPILTYGCEIYGSSNYTCIETFHKKFMKETLNVKKSTNTAMIYAETGRYPLTIHINKCMIKYWLKVINSEDCKLIKVVYTEMLKDIESYDWMLHIKSILCGNGFAYVWENQHVTDTKQFLSTFEQRTKDTFIQQCFGDLAMSSRCRLYREIKDVYGAETYMSCRINKIPSRERQMDETKDTIRRKKEYSMWNRRYRRRISSHPGMCI